MRVSSKFFLLAAAALAMFQNGAHADEVRPALVGEMTTDQVAELEQTKESMTFQTEVARMLDIIINSLYTQRDVFLRELISNAADALEKARYLSVKNADFLKDKEELAVYIDYNPSAKTISITDTGVGMSRADLINNLGTLAKSGTTNFLEAMAGGSDLSLIGQFGVGFYSSYLVADKVTVISRKPGEDQYIWESSADAQFTVAKDPRGNTLGRGTQLILHLKDDATEYANFNKIDELAQKYSQFISYPIYINKDKTVSKEVVDEDNIDEATGEMKTKTVEETVKEFDQVNTQKAIWLRSKDEIEEKAYFDFYKSITKDNQEPLAHTHFSAEGDVEFRSILFIPAKASRDLYENYFAKTSQLKLYVRRVLVAEGVEDFLPKYLHFVRGVVDSDDLPLNVSREQLQQNRIMKTIGKNLVKRTFDMLTKLSKDEVAANERRTKGEEGEEGDVNATRWNSFYGEFARSLKMGCFEDDANRSRIMKLLRFKSFKSHTKPENYKGDYHGLTLEQYIEMIPEARRESQDSIYYMSGESIDALLKAPHLQAFKKRDIDVLLLTEPLDEPCLQKASEFLGKKLVNIQKGDVKFDETEDEKNRHNKLVKAFKPLTAWWKKQLGGQVGKVEISKRLVEDPVTIVASAFGYSAHMERIMKAQAFADPAQIKMLTSSRVLEINPDHVLVQKLLEDVNAAMKKAQEENTAEEGEKKDIKPEDVKLSRDSGLTARFLFDGALIAAGFDLESPTDFAGSLFKALGRNMMHIEGDGIHAFDVSAVESEDDGVAPSGEEEFNFDDFNFDGADDAAGQDAATQESRDEL